MIENKLEFHPKIDLADYRKKARVLAEQAVKQASNASCCLFLEKLFLNIKVTGSLVALTKAHKDQVFARKRKILPSMLLLWPSPTERVLKGLLKAEEVEKLTRRKPR